MRLVLTGLLLLPLIARADSSTPGAAPKDPNAGPIFGQSFDRFTPAAGRYSMGLERALSLYPTMERYISEASRAAVVLELGEDGKATLWMGERHSESSSVSQFESKDHQYHSSERNDKGSTCVRGVWKRVPSTTWIETIFNRQGRAITRQPRAGECGENGQMAELGANAWRILCTGVRPTGEKRILPGDVVACDISHANYVESYFAIGEVRDRESPMPAIEKHWLVVGADPGLRIKLELHGNNPLMLDLKQATSRITVDEWAR
jgi:hypothetical protein